jgi:thiol-disulfide isomerase/thioredoxin
MPPFDQILPLRLVIVFGLAVAAALGQAPGAEAGDDPRWIELGQRASAPASPGSGREAQWQVTAILAWALYESHPSDPRRWTAWEALLRSAPRFIDDAAAKKLWDERTAKLETAVAQAPDAPEPLRELFAGRKVSALVLPFTNGTLPPDWAERLVPPIEELAARFPGGSGAFVYFSRLISAVEAQAPAALPALVTRLEASPNARVRELGEKRRRVLLAFDRPLELKFTALDGREVDTAQWRGKVVIVDFWATWCVPCIQAIPKLKTLYARYHEQGLEIVNISVDNANARPALEKLVAKLDLPWPQFFDGKAHATEYAVRYGVQPIPHVLLAGPDGKIVAVNPTPEKLEAEIKRLLKL